MFTPMVVSLGVWFAGSVVVGMILGRMIAANRSALTSVRRSSRRQVA
jgi:hypothetical protein